MSAQTCLTAPSCSGSFSYAPPSPSALVSDFDVFGLPYAADPTDKRDVDACKDKWERVEERKAGNKQLPKSTWGEDLTVYDNYFGGKLKGGGGFYLELGGFDGVAESNSRFYERCLGWSGLLIEASPVMFPKLMENRPLAHRMNLAPTCEDDGDETVTFLPSKYTNAMIYDPTNPNHVKFSSNTVDVHCGPLKAYLAALGISHIDFFSLDVEGAELLVLRQFDFSAVTVDVVIVESSNVYHKADEGDNLEIRRIMGENGFVLNTELVEKSDVYMREGFVI
ncbi:hypothetical protein TrRE_jg5066 [Triparma retinervis]|uniref:Methyltransferase FkbM domain-containing protein n=1 Tax=Triparma retinervis TaxID=2557542 RepID=A0A9W7A339_9STRA|nr:hypothetical protein TrRE_jg5066 [Triparma retinervis]